MNLLSNMNDLADFFIRPSRHLYKMADMGPKTANIEGNVITRSDFEIKNQRGLTLKGSLFERQSQSKCNNFLIYLHCNSGCRIEGMSYLKLAMEHDFNYVVFDFCGSGLSEGRYVSLGLHQVQDLEAVINHIRTINRDANFCLWGRSMGAVTALRYIGLHKNSIKVAVFDSPFSSLKKLFLELGKQKTNFPEILLSVVYKYIKPIIMEKADFDIDEVDLQEMVKEIQTPGIFVASKQDSLIPFEQIDEVFNRYKAGKEMFFIEESHNQARSMEVVQKVFKALKKNLSTYKQLQLRKHKTSFYSILPLKEVARKKLELTIKSHSQKIINLRDHLEQNPSLHIDFLSDKKQSTCLPLLERQKHKNISEVNLSLNHSESFLETKRSPLEPRQSGSSDNLVKEMKIGRPKFAKETKVIQIKMKFPKKDKASHGRQRKTLQHISSKRPPLLQIKGVKQIRSSLQLRYRS